jgi:cysteine desulfurase
MFRSLAVDLVSISSHKIGGPKGVGALCVKRGVALRPLVTGGSQERRLRPGTENLPGMVGFGKAAELADLEVAREAPRLAALRDRLEQGILGVAPDARVNGATSPRLPNTSNVSFPGLNGETLLMALDLEGIAVSTGAACNAGAAEPSHVLLAMGCTREEAGASLRFSLGRTTQEAEIDETLDVLARVIARLNRNGSVPQAGRALSRE